MLMRKYINIFLVVTLVFLMITVSAEAKDCMSADAYAEESIYTGSHIIWSESEVDDWILEWESQGFFDTLVSVKKENTVIQYEYDSMGHRISKNVNGDMTEYAYDLSGRLISEQTKTHKLLFEYKYSDITDRIYLYGFEQDGYFYEYIYQNGTIVGLGHDGGIVARYEYVNDEYSAVFGLSETGEWTDCSANPEFVGNINPFRYNESYYDSETGWYYSGRYYSAKLHRFIDGMSPEKAAELIAAGYSEYEIELKTYTTGVNLSPVISGRTVSDITDTEIIARVIYLESRAYATDQNCVAWVIKNRYLYDSDLFGKSAVAIVTKEGQFSTYRNDEYNNFSVDTSSYLWIHAYSLAVDLVKEDMPIPDKPTGFGRQMYFSSVRSFLKCNGTFEADGVKYSDCFMVPLGNITPANYNREKIEPYSGKYNVFCNKEW